MTQKELFARVQGNWYYRYLPVWGDLQGKLVTEVPILKGEPFQFARTFVCYPSEAMKREIKDFFLIKQGEVCKITPEGLFKEKHFAVVQDVKVPPEYIKAVLQGKKPNISGLFEQKGNELFRSDSTYWGQEFRGIKVGQAIECCGLVLF